MRFHQAPDNDVRVGVVPVLGDDGGDALGWLLGQTSASREQYQAKCKQRYSHGRRRMVTMRHLVNSKTAQPSVIFRQSLKGHLVILTGVTIQRRHTPEIPE